MGLETSSSSIPSSAPATTSTSSSSATSSSPSGKRNRDPEDEVYVDNLHSHKRYLSEIMASSLNGLTVGDTLPDNIVDSPSRPENMSYTRDEMSLQYSPMSEDSDDSRCYEALTNTSSPQSESRPTSPVSPYRYHKPMNGFSTGPPSTSYPSHASNLPPAATSSQPRQRGSDSEGRFPSSPSDICHSADLRRCALLRSVQMRTQPSSGPSTFDLHFSSGQEPAHMETEDRPCSYDKSLVDEREYKIEQCMSVSEPENQEHPCRILNMSLKGDESVD